MRADDDSQFEELAAAEDVTELCRRLLSASHGWGRSTRSTEAVQLLAKVSPTRELPISFVTLLLCTSGRWDRIATRLLADVKASGILSESDLLDLAELFLTKELTISYRLAWVSPRVLEIDLETWSSATRTVRKDELAEHRPRVAPGFRRWAAQHTLLADPARLDALLVRSDFRPRDRNALVQGLLDAAHVLGDGPRRTLITSGLAASQASVRRTTLDLLCELDGAENALRRAQSDGNAVVRRWQPRRSPEMVLTPSLFPT
jgi:hypothetical protein